MSREIPIETLRAMMECERRMESGDQLFVVHDGERIAVAPTVMKDLNIENGQPVYSKRLVKIIMDRNERVALAELTSRVAGCDGFVETPIKPGHCKNCGMPKQSHS